MTGVQTCALPICFRELAHAGRKPFFAFTAGVAVNVVLGFVLSVYVFASHWTELTR